MNAEHTRPSQAEQILAYLLKGKGLTAMQALNLFDCFRLQARIFQLRELQWGINTEMIETNTGKRVARYTLSKEDIQNVKDWVDNEKLFEQLGEYWWLPIDIKERGIL